MNCQNCGTLNNIGSKFCIKCGKSLNEGQPIQSMPGSSYQEVLNEPINNTLNQNSFQNFDTISQPMNNLSNTSMSGAKVSFMSYFFIILAVILKPFTAFKEELNKFITTVGNINIREIVKAKEDIKSEIDDKYRKVR